VVETDALLNVVSIPRRREEPFGGCLTDDEMLKLAEDMYQRRKSSSNE
jgi:hypothetical protein